MELLLQIQTLQEAKELSYKSFVHEVHDPTFKIGHGKVSHKCVSLEFFDMNCSYIKRR